MPATRSRRSTTNLAGPKKQTEMIASVERAAMTAGLSPWERYKLNWLAGRARAELIGKLTAIELQTVVGEAIAMSEGRVEQAEERASEALFEERLACLLKAGTCRDEALLSAMQLSEGSRDVIANAIDRVTASYISGMEKRANPPGLEDLL